MDNTCLFNRKHLLFPVVVSSKKVYYNYNKIAPWHGNQGSPKVFEYAFLFCWLTKYVKNKSE